MIVYHFMACVAFATLSRSMRLGKDKIFVGRARLAPI